MGVEVMVAVGGGTVGIWDKQLSYTTKSDSGVIIILYC